MAILWKRYKLLKTTGVIALTFLSNLAIGSNDKAKSSWVDTTEIKLGKARLFFVTKSDSTETDSLEDVNARHHWRGIDVGFNGYFINNKLVNLSTGEDQWALVLYRSISVGINLIEKRFCLKKDYLDIVTGAGINFTSYFFKNDIDLISSDEHTYVQQEKPSVVSGEVKANKKDKLKITYAEVPLLLEMHTKKGKAFHIAVGLVGGLKLGSKYKQSYTINKTKHKEKRSDDFNINPFRLNSAIRCGYGRFTMFANYGITELFVSNKTNYELTPISLGISLLGF